MSNLFDKSPLILKQFLDWIDIIAKKTPIIKYIPGFNSLPAGIDTGNLRFYKLSNLVLTLGLFVHLSWIVLFYFFDVIEMSLINIVSVSIYIFSIIINRKGYFFASSAIMVFEIIIHQFIATKFFGWNAGFQNYIIVIGLFPFLMPRGRWIVKTIILGSCLIAYLIIETKIRNQTPIYDIQEGLLTYLSISNIIFSFISLAISGAYFNNAMHETEDLLEEKGRELLMEKEKSDELLLNILPFETALELKNTGKSISKKFDHVSIMFTDFINFTKICEENEAEILVHEIDYYYRQFDEIISKYKIEKIKTIGDSYMCAGGIPIENDSHAIDIVNAALDIVQFIKEEKMRRINSNKLFFEIRCGVHTGPVVAGIVGTKKFAYDIWGDSVNIASRMESGGTANSVNISASTYSLVKDKFFCSSRGKVSIKHKGDVEMYIAERPG